LGGLCGGGDGGKGQKKEGQRAKRVQKMASKR
jgi:hypothetical protein